MKTKIQIKSISGNLLFEYNKENNSINDTLLEAIKAQVNLSGADLYGAYLSGANLSEADLSGAILSGALLSGANLSEADLSGANLSRADLSGALLSRADLSRADLSGANLSGANLSGANLYGADLSRADLSRADLYEANLYGADLSRADLSRADLYEADLSGANLSGADLSGANLSRADLSGAILNNFEILKKWFWIIPEQGSFEAWKKLADNCIAKILIPAKAKRTCNLRNRKCRAEYVKTLAIWDNDGKKISEGINGTHDKKIKYTVGKITKADEFDGSVFKDCSHGIHFFLTKQEAIDW